jgi:hypothetical protein
MTILGAFVLFSFLFASAPQFEKRIVIEKTNTPNDTSFITNQRYNFQFSILHY